MNITIAQAKIISKYLSKNLKDKGVKQSELLELFAHMESFKDWNTFSGIEKSLLERKSKWTNTFYIHIDNGGYNFSYDILNNYLKVETGFFGYAQTETIVKMTIKELEKMFHSFSLYWTRQIKEAKGDCWEIKDGLMIYDNNTKTQMSFFTPNHVNPVKIFDDFINEIKELNANQH